MLRLTRTAFALLLAIPGLAAAQNPADVRFMQGMIGHHHQALVMSALIPAHSTRADMQLLGERITVSQRDEIAMMEEWLKRHDQPLPDTSGHQMHDMPGMNMHDMHEMHDMRMPGMLNQAELDSLAAARDAAFDRMFLRYMIRHHEGALTMVKALLASPGAAQDSEIYRFASDVVTDQRAEIDRMRALLQSLSPTPIKRRK